MGAPLQVIPVILVLSYFTYGNVNELMIFDILWMAGQYLDAIAMVPQILLISKAGKVERYTSHFIGLSVLARFILSGFWFNICVFHTDVYGLFKCGLLLTSVLHILFCSDYMYYWIKT